MKKLFTLSALILAAMGAQAQITISQSDYASWTPSTDSFYDVASIHPATSGTNLTWDLSAASYSPVYTMTKLAVSNAALAGATFGIPSMYAFSGFAYNSLIAYGITAQGVVRIGEVMAQQPFSLQAVTFNPADSLVFTAQVIPYSSPRKMLAFPATYGAAWSSNYSWNTNFQLTVTSYLLNHTPGFRRSIAAETDSVKGWGKIRVKTRTGLTSSYMNVLAVKTVTKITDSFYLAGAPAPAALMTAFGLSQGMVSSQYKMNYYRAGEVEPVLVANYTNSNFDSVSSATTHASRMTAATGIEWIPAHADVHVFPNPVADGNIHLTIDNAASGRSWSYELTDISGRKIAAGALTLSGSNGTIRTGAKLTGVHYLKILKDGQAVSVQPLLMQD